MKIKRKTLFTSIISAFALSAAVFTGALVGNGKTTPAHAAASGSVSILNIDTETGTANTNFENVITGAQNEYVYFGMDGGNPIAWRVLEKNNTKYGSGNNLLIQKATGVFDAYMNAINLTNVSAYWGTSSIRAKLNGNDPSGNPIEYYGWDPSKSARGFMSYSMETSYAGQYFKVGSDTSQLDAIKPISADKPIITRLGVWGSSTWNGQEYYAFFYRAKSVADAMSVDLYDTNGSAKYLSGDTDVTGEDANVIGEKTSGERLFLLDYDDYNNRDFGFVDSVNGLTYLEQVLNLLPGYQRNDFLDGDLSIAASKLPNTDAYKVPYAEDHYLRNPALWLNNTTWEVSGVGAAYGGKTLKISGNGGGVNMMHNNMGTMHVLPATVFDTTKIVYANGSTGYITGNSFSNVQSQVTASGKPEYKLYIKDTNYNSNGFTPYVTSANNKLKVTFNNNSGKAGNVVVLLQDKTATDGSIAYQAVASMSATTAAQTAEFNLPAGITYKNFKPIVMLTSAKTTSVATAKATENVYAAYTQDGIIVPQDISGMEYSATATHWLDNLNLKAGETTPAWIDASMHLDSTIVNVKEIKFTSCAKDAAETTINNADTTKIKNAGEYTVTLELVDKTNYFWQGGGTDDKTFKITVAQAEIDTFNPTVPSGTYYAGKTTDDEDGFPEISPPTAWAGKGTLEWDSGQTLSNTGDYNWTFTPDEEENTTDYADSNYKVSNYKVKKSSSPITVTQIAVGSISAELTGTADIFTSTKLEDLLARIQVTKTNNDGTDGGTADTSEIRFKVGTKLEAGENQKLTIQLVSDTTISCEVTIPEILEVVPVELEVKLNDDAGTIYSTISVENLKGKITVKIKNNDGTTGKTLTTSEFKFAEDFELTDGIYTLNVYKADDDTITGAVQLSVEIADVKKVVLKSIDVPEGVTIWEGAAPNTVKQYLNVEATLDDGNDTVKILTATDNYTVNIVGNSNTLTAPSCSITVTYGGKTSGVKSLTVQEVLVTELTPTYTQAGRTIYSSAKLEDLELDTYLSVDATFNNDDYDTLDPSDYTVTLPENFSSTNNKLTVTWKKGKTTKTATFEVEVTDVAPDSITASYTATSGKNPNALNKPDDLKAGLTVTLTNNDGSTKTLTADEYTLEAAESDTHNSGCLCAGNLTITVKYGEDESISNTFSVTVDKADYPDADKIEFKEKSVTWNGSAYSIEATNLPDGVTVKYACDGKEQEAPIEKTEINEEGYSITAKFSHSNPNYNKIEDITVKLIISAKSIYDDSELTFAATNASGSGTSFTATYDPDKTVVIVLNGNPKKLDSTPVAEEKTYKYEKKVENAWTEVTAADLKNAGEYRVTVSIANSDETYAKVTDKVATLTISKASYSFTVEYTVGLDVTENGKPHKVEVKADCLPDGVTVKYVYGGTEQDDPFEFAEVGDYEITLKFYGDAENYETVTDESVTLKISEKPDHDMGGVEIKPAGGNSGSGLKPDANGGYTGKYGEGGGFEIGVKPEDLPDGVDVKETIIKKKNPDGSWTEVPEIDGAGDYEVTVKFDGGDDHAPVPDMMTPVHIDKGDHDMTEVKPQPTTAGEGSSSTGGLKPSASGGFVGTYSPDGDFTINIPESSLPDGVTPKDPVIKKLKDGGNKDNPADWEVVKEIGGAGEYTVEIEFEADPDNYNPVDPIKTTVSVEKGDRDMSEVKPAPTENSGSLKPSSNGGFTGVYKPDEKFELDIDTGSLPDGVTAKDPVIKKFKEGGNKNNPADWEVVDKIEGVGEYTYEIAFEDSDGNNYNSIDPITTTVTISDATLTGIAVELEEGAEFDIENTFDDIKAKLKVVANLNNGLTEDLSLEDIILESDKELRADGKFDLGEQIITVSYTAESGEKYTQTLVINIGKHKVALPVYSGNYAYTSNQISPKIKDFEGFDRNLMSFVEDKLQSGTNAGTYRAVFALTDTVYYEWAGGDGGSILPVRLKVGVAPYAVAIDEEVVLPELAENEVAVNWNIAKAKITASRNPGEKPVFLSESYKGSFENVVGLKYYVDEALQQEIEESALETEGNYWIVAELLDGDNFVLEESAENVMDTPLSYTHPRGPLTTVEKITNFIKDNLWWIIVAVAAIVLLVIIIIAVSASRKRKAKAAKLAEEERIRNEKREAEERERAERREAEERRLEREERMMRAQQSQMAMPQMPMSMPQYAPQASGGGAGSAEIAELKAEIAALRAEQNAKEMAALRSEISNLRNEMTFAKRGEATSASISTGLSAKDLSEMISTAVRSAVIGVISQESKMFKSSEANKGNAGKTETAQPAAAVYPPDAVTTTVTTTRVDTTKKSEEKSEPIPRVIMQDRYMDTEGMVFDIGGFYDPAEAAASRRGHEENGNNGNNRNNRNRNERQNAKRTDR